ncbi:MAG: NUDIX domain-containing protein [Deltaproteobacteria bacterium]|nr:NUDIX domain-containing protein [Deltaproteobacteria bacterium]
MTTQPPASENGAPRGEANGKHEGTPPEREGDSGRRAVSPPDVLFHGVTDRERARIQRMGRIVPRRRFVELVQSEREARRRVHQRGKENPVVLFVDARRAVRDGVEFFRGRHGTFLTRRIDRRYILNAWHGFRRARSAGAVVIARGEGEPRVAMLEVQRKAGLSWEFPKGGYEPGENAETTAVREAHEELGLNCELTISGWLGTIHFGFYDQDGRPCMKSVSFLRVEAHGDDLSLHPENAEGIVRGEWVPLREVPSRLSHRNMDRVIARVFEIERREEAEAQGGVRAGVSSPDDLDVDVGEGEEEKRNHRDTEDTEIGGDENSDRKKEAEAGADVDSDYAVMARAAGIVDLSTRGKIAVTGSERVSWLNGMVTNDVAKLAPGESCRAFAMTVKGRLAADLRVHMRDDAVFLEMEPGFAGPTIAALDRLLISEDAALRDVTDRYALFTVQGPRANDVKPPPIGFVTRIARTVWGGFDLWVRADERDAAARALTEAVATVDGGWASIDALEVARIEAGEPRQGVDMNEETFVLDLGRWSAISTSKGCYVGQEVVARVDAHGHVNRSLVGLVLSGGEAPKPHAEITVNDVVVGHTLSGALSPALKAPVALALVHRAHANPETIVVIREQTGSREARVVKLPFVNPRTEGL